MRIIPIRKLFLFLVFVMPVTVSAQDIAVCINNLTEADEARRRGQFEQAISLLEQCKDNSALSILDRSTAHKIIAKSYEGLQREQDAKAAIRSLLEIAPDYEPDPNLDSPSFVELVNEVRAESQAGNEVAEKPISTNAESMLAEEKRAKRKKLLLIGGGSAVAIAAAAILLSGGGDDQLPGPPFPGSGQ